MMFVSVVPVVVPPRKCPACGAKQTSGRQKTCPNCGHPLAAEPTASKSLLIVLTLGLLVLALFGLHFSGLTDRVEALNGSWIVGGLLVFLALVMILKRQSS